MGLAAVAAHIATPFTSQAGEGSGLYVSCRREAYGRFAAVIFDRVGDEKVLPLPARGHDLALRPGDDDCVVFARRPGTFACAFAARGHSAATTFGAMPGRHFNGHGVFSTDGRVLYSTENDVAGDAARGVIGIRDATANFQHIGEFDSAGLDPHDMAHLTDGRTLVVANGGIDTDPESGRISLNLATIQPSLVYIDMHTGDIVEKHMLPAHLHKLSIRHLAVGRGDVVIFGCQHEGPAADFPPLIGFHARGAEPVLVEAPRAVHRDFRNYIGSVSRDRSGEIAAALSPRAGLVAFFDVSTFRYLGEHRLSDVCGLAGTGGKGDFVLTNGEGRVERVDASGQARETLRPACRVSWDNHLIAIDSESASRASSLAPR